MTFDSRIYVASSLLLLAVGALWHFVVADSGTAERELPPTSEARVSARSERSVDRTKAVALTGEAARAPQEQAACQACQRSLCTNYQGSGVDLIDGCLRQINPSQGADPSDTSFLADCRAVVECARERRCALSQDGPAGCYCGSKSFEDCVDNGPAENAPCVEQWERATRSHDHNEILLRFSDLKYPAGWANFLIECEMQACKDSCAT